MKHYVIPHYATARLREIEDHSRPALRDKLQRESNWLYSKMDSRSGREGRDHKRTGNDVTIRKGKGDNIREKVSLAKRLNKVNPTKRLKVRSAERLFCVCKKNLELYI